MLNISTNKNEVCILALDEIEPALPGHHQWASEFKQKKNNTFLARPVQSVYFHENIKILPG